MALIDFTLSNAGRFYSSMENPLDGKGLTVLSYPSSIKVFMHIKKTSIPLAINDDIDASIYRASFISCFTDIISFIFFFYTP